MQTVDAGEVDRIFVKVLKHIDEEQDRDDSHVDLAENLLLFLCRDIGIYRALVDIISIIKLSTGRRSRDALRLVGQLASLLLG